MDIFDLGAQSLDRMLKPKDAKAPSLRILEVNGYYQLGFVVYDGIAINTMANGPLEALLVLMAVYYTFDLDYPGVYGQTLGFLQEKVLGEPNPYFKSSNYIEFSKRIKSIMKQH